MARLIVDFHTNCSCGGDVQTTGYLDDEGYLDVNTRAGTAHGAGQVVDAGAALGQVMAPLSAQAINDEADAAELEADTPVATSAPATAPAAQARRGRPRAGGGG